MLPLPLSYHPRSNGADDLHGRVTAGKRHRAINPSGSHPRGTEIELSQAHISFHISVAGVYQDAGPLNWQQGPILVRAARSTAAGAPVASHKGQ
jgi:hypothetical protein